MKLVLSHVLSSRMMIVNLIFFCLLGIVRVDNWINLSMDVETAAAVVALRPALETLVIRAANDPENLNAPNAQEEKAVQVRNLFRRHFQVPY